MRASGLEVHPDALNEVEAGLIWYLERSRKAAEHFLIEIDRSIEVVLIAPERWPVFRGSARRYVMRTFPYSIIYEVGKASVKIYAFAHARKRPDYWVKRLS